MKIACITGRYPFWSEQFIQRDIETLTGLGHEILTWPCEERLNLARWHRPDGSPLPPVIRRDKNNKRSSISQGAVSSLASCGILQLRRLPAIMRMLALLPWEADLVWGMFGTLPAVVGLALSKSLRTPFIASVHARDVWAPWKAGHRALQHADKITCCNISALEELLRQHPDFKDKTSLVHHCVPAKLFQQKTEPQKGCNIVAAGRFVPKKGFDVLIEAFADLCKQHPSARLILVGEGPEDHKYRRLRKSLGIPVDRMEIREKQEPRDLEDTLKSARLLVVPSIVTENKDRDGIPNIMLEAIALGIPIVASAVGGITEVIQNEKYGWLVNPGDPRHLYHCLLRSFAAAEEAAERAESAKRLVSESFSPTSTARAYDSLFKSCL